jgi:TATA-binding protein-associated factor
MNLLAEIYSQEEMIPKMFGALTLKETQEFDLNEAGRGDDAGGIISRENPYMLSTLAPRLWPFMRHSITSVRYSAIRTLVNYFLFYALSYLFFLNTNYILIKHINSYL